MPDLRQKYGLRIAMRPSNAMEAVTLMDLKAVETELDNARTEHRLAKLDCINAIDDGHIAVFLDPNDIQMIMHHKWQRPPQVSVPQGARLVQ